MPGLQCSLSSKGSGTSVGIYKGKPYKTVDGDLIDNWSIHKIHWMIGSVTACKLWDTCTHLLCTCLGDPGNVDETAMDVCDITHLWIYLKPIMAMFGKEPGLCMIRAHTTMYSTL